MVVITVVGRRPASGVVSALSAVKMRKAEVESRPAWREGGVSERPLGCAGSLQGKSLT